MFLGEQFIIGVFATSPDSGAGQPAGPSHFDIVATTTGTTTTLQVSVPIPGVVSGGLYKYYRFDVANAADILFIASMDYGAYVKNSCHF